MADAALAARHGAVRDRGGLWILPPALVLGLLFLYPLALIARQATRDDQGGFAPSRIVEVLQSRAFVNALFNTVEIAVGATAGCVALGLVLALVLAFVPFPGARLVARLIDTFIALPTFLVTLAFTFLYGSAGILNGALAQSF